MHRQGQLWQSMNYPSSSPTPTPPVFILDTQVYVALDLTSGSLLAVKELNILDIPADDQRSIEQEVCRPVLCCCCILARA
jgi:hypothetical protein